MSAGVCVELYGGESAVVVYVWLGDVGGYLDGVGCYFEEELHSMFFFAEDVKEGVGLLEYWQAVMMTKNRDSVSRGDRMDGGARLLTLYLLLPPLLLFSVLLFSNDSVTISSLVMPLLQLLSLTSGV